MELLNELRVALPGVQVLFAFLLAVPFQQAFADITSVQRTAYFTSFLAAALGVVLLIAPSAYHRLRFRHGDKQQMLFTANRMVLGGMTGVAVAMTAAVFLITDLLFDVPAASVITAAIALWFLWFWYGLPMSRALADRRRGRDLERD
jgi:hypothetical protein